MKGSPAPPPPTIFKSIGYVEKAGGQVEAIILQENQVQVVHIGDLISDRYRVTKVSPDSVAAIDETLLQTPMTKSSGAKTNELTARGEPQPLSPTALGAPAESEVLAVAAKGDHLTNIQGTNLTSEAPAAVTPGQVTTAAGTAREDRIAPPQGVEPVANSLGYVQQADGKVEAVLADGDSVRLVPGTRPEIMAQVTLPGHSHEGALPAQVSPAPVTAVSSTREVTADSSVHPLGSLTIPSTSVIRQASYEVPIPVSSAADGSAASRLGMGSVGEAAITTGGASDPAASMLAEKPSGSTDRLTKLPVELKPLGFVVKADGDLAAILSEDDEMYIVRQGDRFAGRYRALSVSADAVEAVEEPMRQALPSPIAAPSTIPDSDLLSASASQGPPLLSNEDCPGCRSDEVGEVSASLPNDPPAQVAIPPPRNRKDEQVRVTSPKVRGRNSASSLNATAISPDHTTFVFQTLGYVERQDGEIQAVVADGSQVYLVKQGETFAEQYLATSVDPILVLAVSVSPGQRAGNFLSVQTESGGKPASKGLYGNLHFPSSGLASGQALHEVDASGSLILTDLGVSLLDSSLTGFAGTFFMADDPHVGF